MMLKDELLVHDGIVLRTNHIVVREILQNQVITLAHASHQGIVKAKQLIREKVWFPGIGRMAETHPKNCLPSQAAVNTPKQRDPLHMSPLPKRPWYKRSLDFAGYSALANAYRSSSMIRALPELVTSQNRDKDEDITNKNLFTKTKQKFYADTRRPTCQHQFQIGDSVIVKPQTQNKLSPPYKLFISHYHMSSKLLMGDLVTQGLNRVWAERTDCGGFRRTDSLTARHRRRETLTPRLTGAECAG
ncbi:hypothetical protein EGW08_001507 [Elysia chlorotica]|uniref:Integrase zinc-binding domain-containing protein n=1 Tax=Elysia chlorotica TaxID=188477 RepID=A0A3S1A4U8_ELYCH|nr:hypothetical protein EGW08_001507 [Elysia chlorotica]